MVLTLIYFSLPLHRSPSLSILESYWFEQNDARFRHNEGKLKDGCKGVEEMREVHEKETIQLSDDWTRAKLHEYYRFDYLSAAFLIICFTNGPWTGGASSFKEKFFSVIHSVAL